MPHPGGVLLGPVLGRWKSFGQGSFPLRIRSLFLGRRRLFFQRLNHRFAAGFLGRTHRKFTCRGFPLWGSFRCWHIEARKNCILEVYPIFVCKLQLGGCGSGPQMEGSDGHSRIQEWLQHLSRGVPGAARRSGFGLTIYCCHCHRQTSLLLRLVPL